MDARDLTTEEVALMSQLLSRDFPGRSALKDQLKHAKANWVREGGACVLAFIVSGASSRALVTQRTPLEAEWIATDVDGEPVHLVLHVISGFLHELEFFREDGKQVQRIPAAESIRYAYDARG